MSKSYYLAVGLSSLLLLCIAAETHAFALLREPQEDPAAAYGGLLQWEEAPESEHTSWAIPLRGGSIRTLFMAPRASLRDVVELAQRIDLDYDVFPFWNAGAMTPPADHPSAAWPEFDRDARLGQFQAAINEAVDVIVAGGLDLRELPPPMLEAVLERVRRGSGLVLVNHFSLPETFKDSMDDEWEFVDPPGLIIDGVGEDLTPEWDTGLGFVWTAKLGEGRIVLIEYPGGAPDSNFLLPVLKSPHRAETEYLDVYLSLIARATYWAAGREPRVRPVALEYMGPEGPDDTEIPPDLPEPFVQRMRDAAPDPAFRPYRIRFSEPAPRRYDVRLQVRDPRRRGRLTHEYDAPLNPGESEYTVHLNVGPGSYFVDIWLLDRGRVEWWHTETLTIESWPSFTDLAFSKDVLQPHDSLRVSLNARPNYYHPREFTIYARATDALGRRVAEKHHPVSSEAGWTQFSVDFADLLAEMVKVEIFAVDRTRPPFTRYELQSAAHEYGELSVWRPRDPYRFDFGVYGPGTPEYSQQRFYSRLADYGVDTVYTPEGEGPSFLLKSANLQQIQTLTSYAPGETQGNVREPCLFTETFWEQEQDHIAHTATAPGDAGPFIYTLGDGNALARGEGEACHCAHCLSAFRDSLREQFSSIAALNEAWGTGYTGWGAIHPASVSEVIREGVYPPWISFRQFMDEQFVRLHDRAARAARQQRGQALVGLSARDGGAPFDGRDWRRLGAVLDLLALPAENLAYHLARSSRDDQPEFVTVYAPRAGELDPAAARWMPWRAALYGMRGVWLADAIAGSAGDSLPNALTPTGAATPAFAAMAEEVEKLRRGTAALLQHAVRGHSGVALYDNRSSYYLNYAEPSYRTNTPRAQQAFLDRLNALGYQCEVIGPEDLRTNRMNEYKVVILPMARALSAEEREGLEAFVQGGGHVIADVLPGQFTEFGAPSPSPPLAEWFGVSHGGPANAGDATEIQGHRAIGDFTARGRAEVRLDPSTEWNGENDGEPGAYWIHNPGESEDAGAAFLFNHPLPPMAADPREDGLITVLEGVLRGMGAHPVAAMTGSASQAFPGERIAYRYGEVKLLAVTRPPGSPGGAARFSLDLRNHAHVYDAIAGEQVRRPSRIQHRLEPGETALFTALPYEVTGLEITAPEEVRAGRRLPVSIRLRSRGGIPGNHLVHLRLEPIGEDPIAHYSQVFSCSGGEEEHFIPLARNERLGRYRLIARDALTGKEARHTVTITGREQE